MHHFSEFQLSVFRPTNQHIWGCWLAYIKIQPRVCFGKRPQECLSPLSRKKKQHKHKLFGPNFLQIFLTLTPGCPGVKKFLPISGAAKSTFWVRTSTIFGAGFDDQKGSWKTLYKNQRLPKGPWNDNSHKATQNVTFLRQQLLSFWLVISRLLARNCCSLAAVVGATVASQWWPGGEVIYGCYCLGPQEVELEHSKVVVSWLLSFHVLFSIPPKKSALIFWPLPSEVQFQRAFLHKTLVNRNVLQNRKFLLWARTFCYQSPVHVRWFHLFSFVFNLLTCLF